MYTCAPPKLKEEEEEASRSYSQGAATQLTQLPAALEKQTDRRGGSRRTGGSRAHEGATRPSKEEEAAEQAKAGDAEADGLALGDGAFMIDEYCDGRWRQIHA